MCSMNTILEHVLPEAAGIVTLLKGLVWAGCQLSGKPSGKHTCNLCNFLNIIFCPVKRNHVLIEHRAWDTRVIVQSERNFPSAAVQCS